jgi:hypothetical protein
MHSKNGIKSPLVSLIKLFFIIQFLFLINGCDSDSKSSKSATEKLPQFSYNITQNLSETEKMALLEGNRTPLTESSADIYISVSASKPDSFPEGPSAEAPVDFVRSNQYSNSHNATFIERGSDETRWLAVRPNTEAANIVWQIADTPFIEGDENWQQATGLLSSESVPARETAFQLDFSRIASLSKKISTQLSAADHTEDRRQSSPVQSSLFARAVAVDEEGSAIGHIGVGLEFTYGDALTFEPDVTDIQIPFPLLSGQFAGLITTGEIENALVDMSEHFYATTSTSPWYFRPDNYPSETHTLLMQVLTVPPSGGKDAWRNPTGLVHEIKVISGQADFEAFATNPYHALPIDIQSFANTSPKQFYIRAVALRSGPETGTVLANYSKTVVVKYGTQESEFTYYAPPEVVTYEANLPDVRLLEYQPIRWEYPDWMYYYEVIRQPTQKEYYSTLPESMIPNPNELMSNLPVGSIINLTPPPPEDTSWLQDAWGAVTGFFSSLTEFLSEVVNWVSETYADIKADLVEFVAENFPAIPQDWRDELQAALTYGLDYGLASVGIPPSLPNFDELSSMGADYIAATALEQAGIPANEYIQDTALNVAEDLGNEVDNRIRQQTNSGRTPNPLNWNFVKPWHEVIYRPAYLQFEIQNSSTEMTPPGVLSGKVFRQLSSSELSNPDLMDIHAAYGGLYFDLYRPVSEVHIPRLHPGQRLTIPIFFKEYTGQAYPWPNSVGSYPKVQPNDFLKMYNNFGASTKFSFRIDFTLPPAQQAAEAAGEPADKLYEYALTSKGFNFTGDPAYAYSP